MTDREGRADDFVSYKRVEPGDIVVNRMRAFEGGAGISAYRGIVSGDYAVLRTRAGLDARFLHHLIRSPWFVGQIIARLRGIGNVEVGNVRTPRINIEDLGDIVVSLPAPPEQRSIAAYLDRETARINTMVEKTNRQIAAVDERFRQLCDDVLWADVRDSRRTTARRLRFIAEVNPDSGRHERLTDDDEVTFMPLEAVWPRSHADFTRRRPWAEARVGFTRFAEGDVLLPKITPTFQAGRAAVAEGLVAGLGAGTTELHIIRPRPDISAHYLAYVLNSRPFLEAGEAAMYGVAGQRRVPDALVRDFRVPIPDFAEQRRRTEQLDAWADHAETTIRLLKRRVGLLLERRQAVSAAALTGHLDIPRVAA